MTQPLDVVAPDDDVLRPMMVKETDLPEGPEPGTVTIAYLSGSTVSNRFLHWMLNVQRADREQGWNRLQHPHAWFNQQSGVNVSRSRDLVCARFLALRDPAPEWLLLCDADMAPPVTGIEQLMAATVVPDDEVEVNGDSLRRVVGGLCLAFGTDPDAQFNPDTGQRPTAVMSTAFDPGPELPGIEILPFRNLKPNELPRNRVREVYGTGAAFLLVHRQVLVDIAFATQSFYGWFKEDVIRDSREGVGVFERNDYWVSEDLWFCLTARACGHRVFVHTGVEVKHAKSVLLTEKLWRQHRKAVDPA